MSAETENTAVTCGECKFMFFGADAVKQFILHPCSAYAPVAIEVDAKTYDAIYDAATPEPPPVKNSREAIQDLVIEDIKARKAKGIREYGTPLQAFNGRDALNDLYQELLDAIFYLRQVMYERAAGPVRAQLRWQGHNPLAFAETDCVCGCSPDAQCGKADCVHEQP